MNSPNLPPPLPPGPECCCTVCGMAAPTKQVMFFQHIGAVILMFNRHIKGRMCRSCINGYFAKYTAITACVGWWGMISCILTPFLLLNNVVRYLFCLGLKSAPHTPASGTGLAILALLFGGGVLTAFAGLVVMVVNR